MRDRVTAQAHFGRFDVVADDDGPARRLQHENERLGYRHVVVDDEDDRLGFGDRAGVRRSAGVRGWDCGSAHLAYRYYEVPASRQGCFMSKSLSYLRSDPSAWK